MLAIFSCTMLPDFDAERTMVNRKILCICACSWGILEEFKLFFKFELCRWLLIL